MLGRPAFGDPADQERPERCKPLHPHQRFVALRPQARFVGGAAEQRVVVAQRRLDLVIGGQRCTLGQVELSRCLALRERPVGDAVLGDQASGDLRDGCALDAVRAETETALGTARFEFRGGARRAAAHRMLPGVLTLITRAVSCSSAENRVASVT